MIQTSSVLFKYYMEQESNLSEKSIKLYNGAIERFIIEVNNLNDDDEIIRFLVKHYVKNNLNYYKYAVTMFLKFHLKGNGERLNKLLNTINVLRPVNKEKTTNRQYYDSDKRSEIIINLDNIKHQIMSLICMKTGIRIGDCLRIKRNNVIEEYYKDKLILRINVTGKRKKRYIRFIHDQNDIECIKEYIKTHNYGMGHELNDSDYLFLQPHEDGVIHPHKYNKGFTYCDNIINNKNELVYIRALDDDNCLKLKEGEVTKFDTKTIVTNVFQKKWQPTVEEEVLKDIESNKITWHNNIKYIITNLDVVISNNYVWYWHDLKTALSKMKISLESFSGHDWRRGFAKDNWKISKDIHMLQNQMGHARADTTMLYLEQSGLNVVEADEKVQQTL